MAAMDGMRSRTVSRCGTIRVNATRLAFISDDVDPDDTKQYAWHQERGPKAIEETVSWQEEKR